MSNLFFRSNARKIEIGISIFWANDQIIFRAFDQIFFRANAQILFWAFDQIFFGQMPKKVLFWSNTKKSKKKFFLQRTLAAWDFPQRELPSVEKISRLNLNLAQSEIRLLDWYRQPATGNRTEKLKS